jgi:SAM-dependent methyltransferase
MRPAFARHYDQFTARMERAWLGDARAGLLAGLTGTVVELGAGTGHNLAHYPDTVGRLVLTEPSAAMRDQLRTHVSERTFPFEVEIVDATADRLPMNDDTADAVVSTLVLCSVPALGPAVAEVRRVLRPGGELRLIEHVAAARPWARRSSARRGPWTPRRADHAALLEQVHEPAGRAKPTLSLRCSIDVEPSWLRTTSSMAWLQQVVVVVARRRRGGRRSGPRSSASPVPRALHLALAVVVGDLGAWRFQWRRPCAPPPR